MLEKVFKNGVIYLILTNSFPSPFCSVHIHVRSPSCVCVHLSVWTSKAGHIQAEPAGHGQGIQTETD